MRRSLTWVWLVSQLHIISKSVNLLKVKVRQRFLNKACPPVSIEVIKDRVHLAHSRLKSIQILSSPHCWTQFASQILFNDVIWGPIFDNFFFYFIAVEPVANRNPFRTMLISSSTVIKNGQMVCVLCQCEYTVEKYLEAHYKSNHKQDLPSFSLRKSDLFFCQNCKCYSQSGDSHICCFNNTRIILRFSCDTCNFFSYHKQGLRYHYRIKHPNLIQPRMFQSIPSGDLIKDRCDDCGKWVTRLKRHKCKAKINPMVNS